MELRQPVRSYSFDNAQFSALRDKVGSGCLDPKANRLSQAPATLTQTPTDLRPNAADADAVRTRLTGKGEAAIKAGSVAILVLNGGMATRFGGGAKGIVPVVPGHDDVSFLAIKLAEIKQRVAALGGAIPVVLMHSFATEDASEAHLAKIGWGGIAEGDRYSFSQSVMPRVLPDGTPLQDLPESADLPPTALYSAPGHGDTLGRLRGSGVLAKLRARGVEHILVSNVDNVGASLDPFVLGAHIEKADLGAGISVEVVRRVEGDAGGCIAQLPTNGRPAIIEGFRLPEGTDLADYPHFNTNTLWLTASAVDVDIPLTWFAVRKKIDWPAGTRELKDGKLEVVQFERLIGQGTEFVQSAYLDVDRGRRFLPIKTRDDLANAAGDMERFAKEAGLL
ncbi:MAG: UTP--glucose-1-phosphate uridylyltransferase [Nannocystaceae bacterium]|nr:UTP--glucose-1-phosphate uridylyltransferase [Nannocystaceae bacterium]